MTEERPVDQVLDLLVYAPIGFALEAKELLPQLADRGRGQVALMRLAGRMAAQQAPEGDVTDTVRQGVSVLLEGFSTLLATDGPAPADATAPAASAAAPIADYDDLTAREIVASLAGRSADDLAAVFEYEQANRGRSTVLNRVEQLLG